MASVGIRELKQNASAVVARAAAGETVVVTDRGRAVAQLGPLPGATLQDRVAQGLVRPPLRPFGTLPPPLPANGGRPLSEILEELREDTP